MKLRLTKHSKEIAALESRILKLERELLLEKTAILDVETRIQSIRAGIQESLRKLRDDRGKCE
jgi:predicted  nucleic acid-binding Zn-ribbon protein